MKICEKAHECQYGHCLKRNVCAYSENLTNKDECPLYAENMEDFIAEITGEIEMLEDILNV